MTSLMDIVMRCENQLGWQPPRRTQSLQKARCMEVHKLQVAIDRGKIRDVTPEKLAIAVEYSRRKRLPVASPLSLLHRIPEALALAYTPPPVSDIAAEIAAAISWERDRDDDSSPTWIQRLARSQGPGCGEVLTAWKVHRG